MGGVASMDDVINYPKTIEHPKKSKFKQIRDKACFVYN